MNRVFAPSLSLVLLFAIAACEQIDETPLTEIRYKVEGDAQRSVAAVSLDDLATPTFGEAEAAADGSDIGAETLGRALPYDLYQPFPLLKQASPVIPQSLHGLNKVVEFDVRTREERVESLNALARPPVPLAHVDTLGGELESQFRSPVRVADPTRSPFNRQVKVFFTRYDAGGAPSYWACSGTLIDPKWVLTAGHCLFDHGSGFNTVTTVVPAFSRGAAPWGDAAAAQLYVWHGWREGLNFDWDVGWIRLDRPVGALTGWHGYGAASRCSSFTGGAFDHAGYPAEPASEGGFDGSLMYTASGAFGGCESDPNGVWFGNEVWFDGPSYGGQSGSGAIRSGAVWAVLSNGKFGKTWDARLTEAMVAWTRGTLERTTPAAFDLHALDVRVEANVTAGDRLSLSYLAHNYARGASLRAESHVATVYLSKNRTVSAADLALSSHTFTWRFPPKGSVRVAVPETTLPACLEAGDYYVGVILTSLDGDTANNDSSGQDAARVRVEGSAVCR